MKSERSKQYHGDRSQKSILQAQVSWLQILPLWKTWSPETGKYLFCCVVHVKVLDLLKQRRLIIEKQVCWRLHQKPLCGRSDTRRSQVSISHHWYFPSHPAFANLEQKGSYVTAFSFLLWPSPDSRGVRNILARRYVNTMKRSLEHCQADPWWLEYVVVRNAGGRAEPAVRDIVILSTMTTITDVVIIHHVGRWPRKKPSTFHAYSLPPQIAAWHTWPMQQFVRVWRAEVSGMTRWTLSSLVKSESE